MPPRADPADRDAPGVEQRRRRRADRCGDHRRRSPSAPRASTTTTSSGCSTSGSRQVGAVLSAAIPTAPGVAELHRDRGDGHRRRSGDLRERRPKSDRGGPKQPFDSVALWQRRTRRRRTGVCCRPARRPSSRRCRRRTSAGGLPPRDAGRRAGPRRSRRRSRSPICSTGRGGGSGTPTSGPNPPPATWSTASGRSHAAVGPGSPGTRRSRTSTTRSSSAARRRRRSSSRRAPAAPGLGRTHRARRRCRSATPSCCS